ncbi:hypothetical protein AVDCRST_MAG94-2438, partial [uncultured Leptolyngbya sp.]
RFKVSARSFHLTPPDQKPKMPNMEEKEDCE